MSRLSLFLAAAYRRALKIVIMNKSKIHLLGKGNYFRDHALNV